MNTGAPWKCEREGFAARSGGTDRATNPYNLILGPDVRPWLKTMQRDMAKAWWKGWDTAHRQLAGKAFFAGQERYVLERGLQ